MDLYHLIPPEEMKRVMSSDASAEIDGTCLTCLDYAPLAELIPKHWTVIDFGCSYNAQSYLFKDHKKLISVDLPMSDYLPQFDLQRFKPPWCELYEVSIDDWLDTHFTGADLDITFAICGYVPSVQAVKRVRSLYTNLFVYYPGRVREGLKCSM